MQIAAPPGTSDSQRADQRRNRPGAICAQAAITARPDADFNNRSLPPACTQPVAYPAPPAMARQRSCKSAQNSMICATASAPMAR
jgi:hypothetical protein